LRMATVLPTRLTIFRRCYDGKCVYFITTKWSVSYYISFNQIHSHRRQVFTTALGNLPALWFLARGSVQFSSRPGLKPGLRCLGGVVTQTGHKPAVFWPGLSYSRSSFFRIHNFGSN
jgi:hypothetical protein